MVPAADPLDRSTIAKVAAHERWAAESDAAAATASARKAFLERFEREVDPAGVLDPVERARRAEHARKAFFLRLSLKAKAARQTLRQQAAEAEIDAQLSALGGEPDGDAA